MKTTTTTTTTKTLHVPREIQQQTWVMNNKLSPGCDQMGTVRTKQCAQSHIPTSVHTCIYLSIYLSIYQYIYIYKYKYISIQRKLGSNVPNYG